MSDADKIGAQFDQAKGQAKETIGKATGNEKMQAEGTFEKVKGEAKEVVENVKDAVKDIFKK